MTGPTLVLVHGFGTSGRLWDRVRPELEGPVLTPDLPGFGTRADDLRFSVDGMADALQEGLPVEGSYILAGHSMGAKVAVVLASRRPAGLAGLLLIAPSPPSPEPMTAQGRVDLKAAYARPDRLRQHYGRITRQPLPEGPMAQLVADGERASRAAWVAWPDLGSREDRTADAALVSVPVWLLTSADDPVITPEVVAAQVTPVFPGAARTLLRESGHLLPLELPAQVAAACRQARTQLGR